MADKVRYLQMDVDDVQRAKAFYEAVFGWRFEPWGPPDYYQARNAAFGALVSMQRRHAPPTAPQTAGVRITMAVEDLEAAMAAITAAGGRMTSKIYRIETVGRMALFEDTEGNPGCVMQYDADELARIASSGPD
jgi:uncharacterized protein